MTRGLNPTLNHTKHQFAQDHRDVFRAMVTEGKSMSEQTVFLDSLKEECRQKHGEWSKDELIKFNQYFINQRSQARTALAKAGGSLPEALMQQQAPSLSAKALFEKMKGGSKGEINQKVNAERQASGIPHTQHAGMLKKALTTEWNNLPEEAKGELEKIAAESGTPDTIRNNLKDLPQFLRMFLESYQGSGKGQVGSAYFEVFVATQDEEGTAMMDHMVVVPPGQSMPSNVGEDLVFQRYSKRFFALAKDMFRRGNETIPLVWDSKANEMERSALMNYIERYMSAHYVAHCDPDFSVETQTIPFDSIQRNPATYLLDPRTSHLFIDPIDMTDTQLHELRDFLAQSTCVFKPLVTISTTDPRSSLSVPKAPSASPVKAHGVTSPSKRKEPTPHPSLPPTTPTKAIESTLKLPSASLIKAHDVTSPSKRKDPSLHSSLPPTTPTKVIESTSVNFAAVAENSRITEAIANTDGSSLGGSPPKLKRKAVGSPLISQPDPSLHSVDARSDRSVARSSPTKQNKRRKLSTGGSASASTSTSSSPETPEQSTTKRMLMKISQSRRARVSKKFRKDEPDTGAQRRSRRDKKSVNHDTQVKTLGMNSSARVKPSYEYILVPPSPEKYRLPM